MQLMYMKNYFHYCNLAMNYILYQTKCLKLIYEKENRYLPTLPNITGKEYKIINRFRMFKIYYINYE
jgi:hypothetical protein